MSGAPQILADSSVALTEPSAARWTAVQGPVLIASSLGGCLVFANGALINVALSGIGRDLGLSSAEVQWLVNAELLPLAALTLVAGALGDRFGQKRIFLAGILLFGFGGLASAFAPGFGQLAFGRFCQGVADALILPNALSLLGQAFQSESKARAVGIWSAAGAVASAIVPALGGAIIDHASWRLTMLVTAPLVVGALAVGSIWIPSATSDERISVDFAGAGLSIVGLGGLGWSLSNLSAGVPPLSMAVGGFLTLAVVAILLLVAVERRRADRAMIPTSLLVSRDVIGANLFTFLLYGPWAVMATLLPFALIRGAGVSAATAGLIFIPLQVLITVISPLAGQLCRRFGRRLPLFAGGAIVALSCLAAMRIGPSPRYWEDIFPATLLLAFGMGLAVAPLTTLVLTSVESARAGTASGINGAVSRATSLVAVALLGGVLRETGPELIEGFRSAVGVSAAVCVAATLAVFIVEPGPHVDYIPPK